MRVEWIARLIRSTNLTARGRARLMRVLDGLTDAHLARLERGMWRRLLLRGLAIGLPTRFNPRSAGDLRARIEARFPHPDGLEPDRFDIEIADGQCRVHRRAHPDPDAVCTIGVADLLHLTRGTTTLTVLWVSGQLTLDGDPYVLLKLPDLFSGPRP
ncbi:MAG: SCP2 sterol-binding domain-containing protein [Micromonosporaceae bacterium]